MRYVLFFIVAFFLGCAQFQVAQEEYHEDGSLAERVVLTESIFIYGKTSTNGLASVDVKSATQWSISIGADRQVDQAYGMEGFWAGFWELVKKPIPAN